jgi:hypothetical protein
MRIIRDYQCDLCGATEEHFSYPELAIEDDHHVHQECPYRERGLMRAHLSPTPTTFTFADRSGHKRSRQ